MQSWDMIVRTDKMRIGLTLFSLIGLSIAPMCANAQNNPWAVQPAPQSWGLPQNSAPSPAPTPEARVQTNRRQAPSSVSMNEAVTCAAALQLATMAAPAWANERGITNISNAWLQKVFALGEGQGVSGDRVPALVEAEMQRQIDQAADNPDTLSRRAFECASRQL
jgi:hypothetical protein